MAAHQGADAYADEAALRMVFPRLVEELKATDVIDDLYQRSLLTKSEYKGIVDASSKEDSKAVNRRVLIAVGHRPPGFIAKLVEILREKHSSLAAALEKALADVTSPPQTDPAPPHQLARDTPLSSGAAAGGDKPSLNALLPVIPRIAVSWYAMGLKLGAKDFTLNLIERSHKGDPQTCCSEMLQNWLNGKQDCGDLSRRWDYLLQVVKSVAGSEASAYIKRKILNWEEGEGEPMEQGPVERRLGYAATHPLSPTLRNMYWPEFKILQAEFSTIVSKLSEVLHALEPAQFNSLLVYLGERLRPMVDGCFPAEEFPDLPDGPITPLVLIQHLQKRNYWNYLNIELIEDVINHICQSILQDVSHAANSLQALMMKYKKNTCSKVTRTLKECRSKKVEPKSPPNYTAMAVELNPGGNPLSFHLFQILQLKELLVNTFGVRGALFAGWSEGSIVLYFFIPEETVYSLCPKLESSCAALQHLHVTTVVVFEHFSVDVGYQQMALLHKTIRISGSQEEVRSPRIKRLPHSAVAEPPSLQSDSGIVSKGGSTSSLGVLKQDSGLISKQAGVSAKAEADIADLQKDKSAERIQKLTSELTELRLKDEAKAEQLKAIEQMTAGVARNVYKMSFDETKERFRDIHRMSMPGYLPPPVEETAEPLPSTVPPKKPISTSSRIKAPTKREHHPSGPETCETYKPRNVTLRNKPPTPPTKPTSMPRRK